MKRTFGIALFALAACGPSDPPLQPEIDDSAPGSAAGVRYDRYGTASDLSPPIEDLVNPVKADAAAIQQGAALFGTMNCDGCHGGGGLGFTAPSLVDGRWRYGGADGALFESIFYGRPRGMPAYGGLLADATVWQLVTYIQSLPPIGVVPTVAWSSQDSAADRP